MLDSTCLEMRSTEHTRSNAQQSKLAPQRPPATTIYSVHNYPSLTICSGFNALFAIFSINRSMHLLSTYLEEAFPAYIQQLNTLTEKTFFAALHKTSESQGTSFDTHFVV